MTTVFVVGGAGALGRAFIDAATNKAYTTVCIDIHPNPTATHNHPPYQPLPTLSPLASTHNIVICAAGSWSGGALDHHDNDAIDALTNTNLKPSLWSGGLALHLAKTALTHLVLTSAHASLNGTPTMAAYGATKAAVNHVAATAVASGLPCLVLLPAVLDTAANRRDMGEAQVAQWTPCNELAEHVLERVCHADPAAPAHLERLSILTKHGKTDFKLV